MHKMNEHVQTSPNKNWGHASHVQNDGGDGEGEEGEGEREEDPVGHGVVSVCCPAGYALISKLQKIHSKKQAPF